jgi:hypothetical protein
LSPAHLVEEAKESIKESIKEVTVGKVEHLAETVVDMAKGATATAADALHSAVDYVTGKAGPSAETAMEKIAPAVDTAKAVGVTAKGAGATIVDTVRRNPLPAAMIGFGLGWLALSLRKRQNGGSSLNERESTYDGRRGRAYRRPLSEDVRHATSSQRAIVTAATNALHGAGDAMNHFGTGARDKASDLAVATKEKAQEGYSALDRWVHENPLAAGAAALLVGAAVGLALPATAKENEVLGPKRDELARKSAETAQYVVGKVQTAAEKAIGTAKHALGDATGQIKSEVQSDAQNQGLTVA